MFRDKLCRWLNVGQVRFTTKVSLEDPGEVEAVLGRVQVSLLTLPYRTTFTLNFNFYRGLPKNDCKAAILC